MNLKNYYEKLVERATNATRKPDAFKKETLENVIYTIREICNTDRDELFVSVGDTKYPIDKYYISAEFEGLVTPRGIYYEAGRYAENLIEFENTGELPGKMLSPSELEDAITYVLSAYGKSYTERKSLEDLAKEELLSSALGKLVYLDCFMLGYTNATLPLQLNAEWAAATFKASKFAVDAEPVILDVVNKVVDAIRMKPNK